MREQIIPLYIVEIAPEEFIKNFLSYYCAADVVCRLVFAVVVEGNSFYYGPQEAFISISTEYFITLLASHRKLFLNHAYS